MQKLKKDASLREASGNSDFESLSLSLSLSLFESTHSRRQVFASRRSREEERERERERGGSFESCRRNESDGRAVETRA